MKIWRWLPGVAVMLAVYALLHGIAGMTDDKSAIIIAVIVVLVAIGLKLLGRPKK